MYLKSAFAHVSKLQLFEKLLFFVRPSQTIEKSRTSSNIDLQNNNNRNHLICFVEVLFVDGIRVLIFVLCNILNRIRIAFGNLASHIHRTACTLFD